MYNISPIMSAFTLLKYALNLYRFQSDISILFEDGYNVTNVYYIAGCIVQFFLKLASYICNVWN